MGRFGKTIRNNPTKVKVSDLKINQGQYSGPVFSRAMQSEVVGSIPKPTLREVCSLSLCKWLFYSSDELVTIVQHI